MRVAAALPERFAVVGVLSRSPERRRRVERDWRVPTFGDLAGLLGHERPEFVVVSVERAAAPDLVLQAVAAGLPVLAETPPAPDLAALLELHDRLAELPDPRVQVAEQYHLVPLLRAQLEIVRSGCLGEVHEAFVSACHDYHGVSLLRRFLGVGFERAVVTADVFTAPLTAGPTRRGDPVEERVLDAEHLTARIRFGEKGDRLGVLDFTSDQYYSWIRSDRVLVRGVRGELADTRLRYLLDHRTPMESSIERVVAGTDSNHEGMFLRGLVAAGRWVYRNPFLPARLTDDELAMAECLVRMAAYASGGPSFYGLAEASQDHYLQLAVRDALAAGREVTTSVQPWASQTGSARDQGR
jgi:predicted dehydrogenase